MNEPTIGLSLRYEPAGPKPSPVAGCVWISEDNPHAGNCEAQWQWALYRLANDPDPVGPYSETHNKQS